jgi:hypothetical protein
MTAPPFIIHHSSLITHHSSLMKFTNFIIASFIMLQSVCAQTSLKRGDMSLPPYVRAWIAEELATAQRQEPMDFDKGEFFALDTARLIGYINNYKSADGFTTGLIYFENVITNEDEPIVAVIHEDGCFEALLPLRHPVCSTVEFKQRFYPFYIKPGQTLAMLFALDDRPEQIEYQGFTADVNRELNRARTLLPQYDEALLYFRLQPDEQQLRSESAIDEHRTALAALLQEHKFSQRTELILKNELEAEAAMLFLNYASRHQRQTQPPPPLSDSFYKYHGIPRYVLVSPDGAITNDNAVPHQLLQFSGD